MYVEYSKQQRVIVESNSSSNSKSREQRAESTAIVSVVSVVSEYAVTYQLHISYVSVA